MERTRVRFQGETDRVRIDTTGGDEEGSMIFRSDKGLFWNIDHKTRTYMEATKANLERARAELKKIREVMERELAKMSPEERAAMEAMMPGQFAAAGAAIPFRYEKVASGETVRSWSCDRYEGKRELPAMTAFPGGPQVRPARVETEDLWTVAWKDIGISPEEARAFGGLSDLFKDLGRDLGGLFPGGDASEGAEEEEGYTGLPVKSVTRAGDEVVEKMEVEEARKTDFDPSLFELPKGYRKKASPLDAGGAGVPPWGGGGDGDDEEEDF